MLSSIMALADRVLALPGDAPETASLTQRLNESLSRQSSLSGVALLAEESFAELIAGQRLQYLSISTQQVLLLQTLKIDDTSLR